MVNGDTGQVESGFDPVAVLVRKRHLRPLIGRIASQAGVEQQVDGNASYTAWFQWFVRSQIGGTINDFSANKVILGDTSPLSPALASLFGNIYMAWKGDGNDNLSVIVSTDNGRSFLDSNKFISTETSDQAPALAVNNGRLFIAWKGKDNDNLNVAVVDLDPSGTGRPTGFSNKVTSTETSDQAPALAANNGSLFIAWKGSGNDNLSVAAVDIVFQTGLPTGLSNKIILGDTSPNSPALGSLNGYLFLSWKGDGNDNLSLMFSIDNGQTFSDSNKFISPETSDDAPALTTNKGNLFIAWKGSGNDNLSVSLVDVTGFVAPMYVNQTNIPNFPVKPGDTVSNSVQYIKPNTTTNQNAGSISFANETTGAHFSLTVAPPLGATFNGESVEWIMEAPDFGEPISSLPSFTPVQFTGAFGCGPNGQTLGDPQTGDIWNIVNASNKQLTTVTLGSLSVTIDFIG